MSYIYSPIIGHLKRVFQIFLHLRNKCNPLSAFDPSYSDIQMSALMEYQKWEKLYSEVEEEVLPNNPESLKKEVDTREFVDSDHANNKVSRR